ncbi:hypothetical protein YC2023_100223 [Brassica napus]
MLYKVQRVKIQLYVAFDAAMTKVTNVRAVEVPHPMVSNSPEFLSCCSSYALSIVLVSVGDGPWTDMMKFNDKIPKPAFNNFQVSSHFQDHEERFIRVSQRNCICTCCLKFRFCDAPVAISFTEQT